MKLETPDIFTVLSPAIFLARLTGYAPYRVKVTQTRLRRVEYTLLYDVMTYVTHLISVISNVYVITESSIYSSSRIISTYRLMNRLASLAYLISVTVFNKIYVCEVILVLNSLHEVETALLKLGCRIDYARLKRVISAVVTLEIMSMLFQIVLHCYQIPDEYSKKIVIITFTIYNFNVAHVVVFCKFFAVYYVLSHFLNLLNEFCLANFSDVESRELADIYQRLWMIATSVNKTLSVQLLLIYCMYFWDAIEFGQNILMYFTHSSLNQEQFCMFVYYTLKSGAIIHISRRCMKNGAHTNNILWTLLSKRRISTEAGNLKYTVWKGMRQVKKPIIRKELNAVALQLLHEEIQITAGGFFVLDIPIIMSIIGAVTTYMVILVQFQ